MLGEVRGVGSVLKSTLGMGPSPPDPKSFLPLLIFLNFTWKGSGVSGIHVGIPSGNVGSPQSLEGVTHPKKLRHSRSLPDPNPRKGPGASRGLKDGGVGTSGDTREVSPAVFWNRGLCWQWLSRALVSSGDGCHSSHPPARLGDRGATDTSPPFSGSCSVLGDALGTSSSNWHQFGVPVSSPQLGGDFMGAQRPAKAQPSSGGRARAGTERCPSVARVG